MQSLVSNIDNYKSWVFTNVAYIATAVSGTYILKSVYDGYSSYSKENALNKRIAGIIKIELAKRKEQEKSKRTNKHNNNSSNINNDSLTRSIYLSEDQNQSQSNGFRMAHEGIQTFFASRNINAQSIDLQSNHSDNQEGENDIKEKEKKAKKKEDLEFYYYTYYKCLKTIYENDFAFFERERRQIYKENNILKYISFVEKFQNRMKYIEDYLLKQVFLQLGLSESLETEIKITEMNFNSINYRYYEDLELEIPEKLDLEKINEIVVCLFDQTKEHLNKVQNVMNLSQSNTAETDYLLAENMAFDYIYHKHGFTENQIRKAVVNYNLTFEIVGSDEK
mmetsp:Transcript_23708/g.24680  ORF Transcript_23708/g.24680 Transcript_23708/m.24680 type:complete len:336 (+) Transcript_23708:29-1036(+)